MAYHGLADFIDDLKRRREIHCISTFVDPVLEISEIADRVNKNNGKALLFENTGTSFPLLINAFGSDTRLAMALGREDIDSAAEEIMSLPDISKGNIFKKISSVIKISGILPSRIKGRGTCQQVINRDPDLGKLPVLKCWPYDGGRFITLPIVHTIHPGTGKTNAGMYRMQILGKDSAAIHWQLHKTGARHFEAWGKSSLKMPVSVTLGGDPVYTYVATAPLPENVDEYILAGFLRKKKVKMVKCITNNLKVPADSDIVIEGYVDPSEEPVMEGPFGDHTGFYSLANRYPVFHVTCITHSKKAVYPATIVGIPPNEDAWFIKATEKIFLPSLKIVLQPEIDDFHMPEAGVAHNLVIVKISKTYPGQGRKVVGSFYGAGQLMLTKYLVVVSGDVDIRNYPELAQHVFENADFRNDLIFTSGPLDVLDHSSDTFAFGGKLGIDATIKLEAELSGRSLNSTSLSKGFTGNLRKNILKENSNINILNDLPIVITGLCQSEDPVASEKSKKYFRQNEIKDLFRLVLAVDHTVDVNDLYLATWQILGNSDPRRDIEYMSDNSLFIDGTIKSFHSKGFPRRWPNIVCSDKETIERVDKKWESLEIGAFIPSPSLKNSPLYRDGGDEIVITNI
jgi:4-hydroxy-3-polyprenylbenzoate decarboxylase